jgi:hypothetical protein
LWIGRVNVKRHNITNCIMRRSINAPRQSLLGYKINGKRLAGNVEGMGKKKNANGG